MPYKPQVPCHHSSCPNLVEPWQLYCEEYKALNPEWERSKANKKVYNSRWQKALRKYLASHPLCEACLKEEPPRYTKATVVDHIVPHWGEMKLF